MASISTRSSAHARPSPVSRARLLAILMACMPAAARADFTWANALTLFDVKDAPPAISAGAEAGLGSWAKCRNAGFAGHPIQLDANNQLVADCQPDTLYSWGHSIKLMSFLKQAAGTGLARWDQPFTELVFAHINPLATFGYGDIPIRIRLKDTARFVYTNDRTLAFKDYCTRLLPTPADLRDGVIVRAWANADLTGVDYILCTPGPIHSWSYGTPRHYDEIIASQLWTTAVASVTASAWLPYGVRAGVPQLYDSGIDGQDWSVASMLNHLRQMSAEAREGLGQIVYAPDVKPDEAAHFRSSRRVYWHWQ